MEDKQEPKNTESHRDFYVYCVFSPFKNYYYFAFSFRFLLIDFSFLSKYTDITSMQHI